MCARAFSALCVFAALSACGSSADEAPDLPLLVLDEQLVGLAREQGLELVAAHKKGRFDRLSEATTWNGITQVQLNRYSELLSHELRLYPAEFLRAIHLQRILLCGGLAFDGQPRVAVPEFLSGTLYLDASHNEYGGPYLREALHHELFHVFDFADDGQLYTDRAWSELNVPVWHYGSGGKNAQEDGRGSLLSEQYPGFLSSYSTKGVEEDKAEVFAHLVVEPENVQRRARADPVIAAKVGRIELLLRSFAHDSGVELWDRIHRPH